MPNNTTQSLPPLEWLRAFESAGRHLSFTAAGVEIGLTQAAISQRISSLEAHLQRLLFRRLHRGVELTVDGDAYLPLVTAALADLRRGTADLFEHQHHHITIASSTSLATLWIVPRLAKLNKEYPELEISLVSILRNTDFDEGNFDYQVRSGDGLWPDFEATLLFSERLVPVCTPALLESAQNTKGIGWRGLPRIALTGPREGWNKWAETAQTTLNGRTVQRFDTFSSALAAALAGAGILLASLPLTQPWITSGQLVILDNTRQHMQFPTWLLRPKLRPKSSTDDIIVRFLRHTPSE